jgi:adenylate kinase family enzyme
MVTTGFPYQCIVIVGSTGCGKTTLAGKLAQKLALEHVELDALYWEADWTGVPREIFRARVEQAVSVPGWVCDGNYRNARDILWPRAQALIWLDYPFMTIFWRLLRRTWRDWRTQEPLCNGNHEVIWRHFKLWSNESIFHWLVESYGRHKREYPELFLRLENRHLAVLRFETPAGTQAWLDNIGEVRL